MRLLECRIRVRVRNSELAQATPFNRKQSREVVRSLAIEGCGLRDYNSPESSLVLSRSKLLMLQSRDCLSDIIFIE